MKLFKFNRYVSNAKDMSMHWEAGDIAELEDERAEAAEVLGYGNIIDTIQTSAEIETAIADRSEVETAVPKTKRRTTKKIAKDK